MSSPFQQSFSAKSPLSKHGEIKKLLRQAKNENPQDRDHERIADLETEHANAKSAHKKNKSKDQNNIPSTADEQQSTINMNSPAKAVDELKGNMVKKLIKIDPNKLSDPNNRPPREIPSKKESPELKPPVHKNYPPKKKLKA